ncbi:hypothetical protein C9J85_10135 [Haloferax sp. wsp5]|nr:hypothetical protein C9J85_10135 [Haloferax sp. wsp5]
MSDREQTGRGIGRLVGRVESVLRDSLLARGPASSERSASQRSGCSAGRRAVQPSSAYGRRVHHCCCCW